MPEIKPPDRQPMGAPYRPPRLFGRNVAHHGQVLSDMSGAMLTSLMRDTLDPGYAEAAGSRRAKPEARSTSARIRALAMVLTGVVAAGLIVGVAYANTTRAKPAAERIRATLVGRIDGLNQSVTGLQKQRDILNGKVATRRNDLLTTTSAGSSLVAEVTKLETASADVPVKGSGITITVADPKPKEGADPVGGQATAPAIDVLITDRDLQRVVNELWFAHAEAIAINGQRIGPTTAIRLAGEAILVDFIAVTSPYQIEAIGPTNDLQTSFANSATGRRLLTYQSVYGAKLTISSNSKLELPAALAVPVTATVIS